MWISRRKYEQRISEARDEAVAGLRTSMEGFGASVQKIANDAIARAEARAEAAESSLREERRQHTRDMRHVMSMFLRREKTFPLPMTKEEKAEVKAEAEEIRKTPPPLTPLQVSMRDANRKEAARFGIAEEEADRDFEQKILSQMMS